MRGPGLGDERGKIQKKKIQATVCASPLQEEQFEPQGCDAGSDHRIRSNNTRLPSDVEARGATRGWWGSFAVCYGKSLILRAQMNLKKMLLLW